MFSADVLSAEKRPLAEKWTSPLYSLTSDP